MAEGADVFYSRRNNYAVYYFWPKRKRSRKIMAKNKILNGKGNRRRSFNGGGNMAGRKQKDAETKTRE